MKILIVGMLIANLFIGGCTNSGLSDNNNTDNSNKSTIKQDQKIDNNKEDANDNNKKKNEASESEPDTQSNTQDNKPEPIKPVEERRNFVISQCIMCDKLIHESDEFEECDSGYLCIDCYNKGYCKCLNCGKTINGYDEGIVNGSSGSFCNEECADQYINSTNNTNSDICPNCGKHGFLNNDDIYKCPWCGYPNEYE